MRNFVFNTAQRALRSAYLHVEFDRPVRNIAKLCSIKARELGIRTLLDVGANAGQFVTEIRSYGYRGPVVSFEPVAAAYRHLEISAASDDNWIVAPRMALGDVQRRAEINVSKNLASSSILQVAERSVRAAPGSKSAGVEEVTVNRLDDILDVRWAAPFAIKLDTQGYELYVLRGAAKTLARTKLVIAELSLQELYAGGARFIEVFKFLEENDFRCISLVQGFSDYKTNELLQTDCMFVRQNGFVADAQNGL